MRRLDPFQWLAVVVVALLVASLLTGCGGYGGGYYDPPVYVHVHHYVTHIHVHVYHSYGFRRR